MNKIKMCAKCKTPKEDGNCKPCRQISPPGGLTGCNFKLREKSRIIGFCNEKPEDNSARCSEHNKGKKPLIGCNYEKVSGVNTGEFCNKPKFGSEIRCKEHLTYSLPDKCSFYNEVFYCNKALKDSKCKMPSHNETESKCKGCNDILTPENKASDRLECKSCFNERKRIGNIQTDRKLYEEMKAKGITTKICEGCYIEKEFLKFKRIISKKCRDCLPETQVKSKDEIIKEHFSETRTCISCKETKDCISGFSIHTNNFRNQCKVCIKGLETYKTWRLKQRMENLEEFLSHNAEIHRNWVVKNKETYEEYMQIYLTTKNYIASRYTTSASRRNLIPGSQRDFKSLIEKLISMSCFYCGETAKEGCLKQRIAGKYNGIDRLDSSQKYTSENCVACCNTCNMMKNTLDIASFVRKCCEISLHMGLNDNLSREHDQRFKFHHEIELIGGSCSYSKYEYRAKERKKHFELLKKDFDTMIKKDCYLCGKYNSKGIGIDRVDNIIGYVLENCRPCCSYCNYIKKGYALCEVLSQIQKIVKHTYNNVYVISLCDESMVNRSMNHSYTGLQDNLYEDDIFEYNLLE